MTVTAGLTSLLADLGTVFTAVIGYFGTVFTEFMAHPILILTVGITFASIVINMARGFLGR
jgi:hypothetical protein